MTQLLAPVDDVAAHVRILVGAVDEYHVSSSSQFRWVSMVTLNRLDVAEAIYVAIKRPIQRSWFRIEPRVSVVVDCISDPIPVIKCVDSSVGVGCHPHRRSPEIRPEFYYDQMLRCSFCEPRQLLLRHPPIDLQCLRDINSPRQRLGRHVVLLSSCS